MLSSTITVATNDISRAKPVPMKRPYVFLSYPRSHKATADRVVRALDGASVQVWTDRQRLKPVTEDWQAEIRKALRSSDGVIVLASPTTARSVYVRAEVELAHRAGLPIVALWVEGDHWIECVPLGLANHQYIDCRGPAFLQGVEEVAEHFLAEFNGQKDDFELSHTEWPGRLLVRIGRGRKGLTVSANCRRHQAVGAFLDAFYTRFLLDRYPPNTYGETWVLVADTHQFNRVVAPWQWLTTRQAHVAMASSWSRTPLADVGLRGGSRWMIVDEGLQTSFVVGIAANRPELLARDPAALFKSLTRYDGRGLGQFLQVSASGVEPASFTHTYLFECHIDWLRQRPTDPLNTAFVERTDEPAAD